MKGFKATDAVCTKSTELQPLPEHSLHRDCSSPGIQVSKLDLVQARSTSASTFLGGDKVKVDIHGERELAQALEQVKDELENSIGMMSRGSTCVCYASGDPLAR